MLDVRLIGSPLCCYQKMKAVVLDEAEKLVIQLDIHEIGDTGSHAHLNPLSLPRLYIQENLISSKIHRNQMISPGHCRKLNKRVKIP
jgi:hypothetical protein